MTLTELHYIVALAREQHFGRAASQCFVSQPTLSAGIKKLEKELGLELFERSRNSVRVTDMGERIVHQAEKVLQEVSFIKQMAQEGKGQLSTPLRVGAIYTIGPYLFPHLVPKLAEMAGDMPLYIEENFTAVLRQKLRDGHLDAIIIALPFTEPDVLTMPIYDESFRVLVSGQHPWAERDEIDKSELSRDEVLLLGEGHCFRDQVLETCPMLATGSDNPDDLELGSGIEATSLETIRHMVASGIGISVLPESALGNNHYAPEVLTSKPFCEPKPQRTVALAWRASFPRPKAIDVLSSALKQCTITNKVV